MGCPRGLDGHQTAKNWGVSKPCTSMDWRLWVWPPKVEALFTRFARRNDQNL